MKDIKQLLLGLLLGFLLTFSGILLFKNITGRYQPVVVRDSAIFMVDTFTGKTKIVFGPYVTSQLGKEFKAIEVVQQDNAPRK